MGVIRISTSAKAVQGIAERADVVRQDECVSVCVREMRQE